MPSHLNNCDLDPIRAKYNITGENARREEAYGYKYLLDVDGNTVSGRYLGLLRSWVHCLHGILHALARAVEHFIPVWPDLTDLAEKVEWARANDAAAHRIQHCWGPWLFVAKT
ncbi:hypothetical protein C8R45DRAFT_1113182 [Mycena sanguinolenta]|nr:hypothetical protein C8R45DRAFT_1113182 [Mycena sanguinolenta]